MHIWTVFYSYFDEENNSVHGFGTFKTGLFRAMLVIIVRPEVNHITYKNKIWLISCTGDYNCYISVDIYSFWR